MGFPAPPKHISEVTAWVGQFCDYFRRPVIKPNTTVISNPPTKAEVESIQATLNEVINWKNK